MDGAPILGGRYSMSRCNNQPSDGFGGGWAFERRWDWAKGGRLLIVLGGKLSDYNNENRECDGAIRFNGFLWMGECNNQPKNRPLR